MKFLTFIITTFLVLRSFAGTGTEGGGGDVIIFPDDSVVLADPWLNLDARQPNNMPPQKGINPRILQLAGLYHNTMIKLLKDLSPYTSSEIGHEISNISSRKSGLRFYAVQTVSELNDFCASGGKKTYTLPEGQTANQVACTSGVETFLVEPLFLRLSLRDQVLLLIHERLTTLRDEFGGKNYSAIARFTTGLGEFIDLYKKESEGVFPVLDKVETEILNNFYIAIEEIQFRNSDPNVNTFQWRAHPFGGGRVHSTAKVDPTTLITINSLVDKNSTIGENSKIINSILPKSFDLGARSTIQKSNLSIIEGTKINIGNDTSIINSTITAVNDLHISDQQKLQDGIINVDIQELYYPLGMKQPESIILNWISEERNFYWDDNQEYLLNCMQVNTAQLTTMPTVKKEGLFGKKYKLNVSYTLNLIPELNKNEHYFVVNDGEISRAGFEKKFILEKRIASLNSDCLYIFIKQISKKLNSLNIKNEIKKYITENYHEKELYEIIFPMKN